MKVAFAADALADPQAARHLAAIWWLFHDQRHTWVVDNHAEVSASTWVQDHLTPSLRAEVLDHATRRARQAEKATVVVRAVDAPVAYVSNRWEVGADQAERWLRAPVRVLVENAKIDGTFLRLVVTQVGRARLIARFGADGFRRLQLRWAGPFGDGELFQVLHGGGTTTAEQLRVLVESQPDLPPRSTVIVDSDKSGPDAKIGETAQKVCDACDAIAAFPDGWKPQPIVLLKREVENYLPHAAIRKVRGDSWSVTHPDYDALKPVLNRKLAHDVFSGAEAELHEAALRDRAGDGGRELDDIIDHLLALL